ncbi:MAG: hypothetical protein E6X34_07010 [Clostridium sp.]|uniref:hypothetical protein n=1 Tax=Clostridium sp. TaxID=1506 RepID=UPI00290CE663|nr:hypothetical protein [Clostridium sp.]MDU4938189.1 hypothetical protein [Clostridium sp.]
MKCLKCNSDKIKVVKAPPVQMQKGIMPKLLNPYYYICCECGYTEIWINSKEELSNRYLFSKNKRLKKTSTFY